MTRFSTGPDRAELDFLVRARSAFRFLEGEFGYSRGPDSPVHAKWTSRKAEVIVVHEAGSYELNVSFRPRILSPVGAWRSLRGDGTAPFSLADVAAWRQARDVLRQLPIVAETPEDVDRGLTLLAAWTRELGVPLLRAELAAIRSLDRVTVARAREATKRAEDGRALS